MRAAWRLLPLLALAAGCSAVVPRSGVSPALASSSRPCVGSGAPAHWKHVVVLIFENKSYPDVIGNPAAPFISGLADACGSAYSGEPGAGPTNNWHDADYRVDGSQEWVYISKPSYATLTSGLSPSAHGLVDDSYSTTSSVDNIYNQLRQAGKSAKSYYDGPASPAPCAVSSFKGAYHDPIRYYTNLGGQSADPGTYCNTHDLPLSTFLPDLAAGKLPELSIVLPTNDENMHDNSVATGDVWARSFLTPILDSPQYKKGDTAIFFLWDEDTAIPNVLIAPSVQPGSRVPAPTGNPISHFSALRTWEEMLGLPPLGDAGRAPSLLGFFNGK